MGFYYKKGTSFLQNIGGELPFRRKCPPAIITTVKKSLQNGRSNPERLFF